MAHPCFECGGECYCSGSIDDAVVDLTPMSCTGCDWCQEQEERVVSQMPKVSLESLAVTLARTLRRVCDEFDIIAKEE